MQMEVEKGSKGDEEGGVEVEKREEREGSAEGSRNREQRG